MKPDWAGQTAVCIASGPSLTAVDCARVKIMGYRTIVTNTTFRMCPWADVLFGNDMRWWREYGKEVQFGFSGRKLCGQGAARQYGAELVEWATKYNNSGCYAVSIAIAAGAGRVLLLGFDACADESGRKHWHDDHPKGLDNCVSMDRWPYSFGKLAKEATAAGCEVLNASRRTALTCFPRVHLEEAL